MKYYKLISRLTFITFFSLLSSMAYSEESSSKFNVYSGMFDFSDAGKKSTLIGFQHQNEDLNRDTFLGNLSPITGALLTADSAAYIYTGVQAQYKLGPQRTLPMQQRSMRSRLRFEGQSAPNQTEQMAAPSKSKAT